MLWAAVLAAQALPYAAAVVCSWIARHSGRTKPIAVPQPAAELAPVRVAA